MPRTRLFLTTLSVILLATNARAAVPAPANDDPGAAQVIGPAVPIRVFGTTVAANDSISVTTLAAPANDVDGPDVFYSFTPSATATYRVELVPWQHAPLRSSDRQFTVYVQNPANAFIAGARASTTGVPLQFNVALTAATTYRIGVDYSIAGSTTTTQNNFPFTLLIDNLPVTLPDACASVIALSSTLPEVVLNDLNTSAAANFTYTPDAGRCENATSNTGALGRDHVYQFTPAVDGEYTFELASSFNCLLYIDDSCPPFFPDGCVGSSDHSSAATGHELVTATLVGGRDYFVVVDATTNSTLSSFYALIVDQAANYTINEAEPNNAPGSASALVSPVSGGMLAGPDDEDWWAVPGSTGDRVYAWTFNGGTINSTLDMDLYFFAADGTTQIEVDEDDADGADAPIQDLRFIYSTSSAVIAGAKLTSNSPHYLRATKVAAAGTVHRYLLPAGVEPGTRAPAMECEPNEATSSADRSGKHYYSGVVTSGTDVDTFAFDAAAGDVIAIFADGDPERDATGTQSGNTDPNAFHPKLIVLDPAGDILISDISDANDASTSFGLDYPAQAGYFVARSTGRHYVQVTAQSTLSQTGPTETYELAIFVNGPAAPSLTEDIDPTLTLTPNTMTDTVAVLAEDTHMSASGICNVELVGATNLQITGLSFMAGDAMVTCTVGLVNSAINGFGKLLITDCEGNTDCGIVRIDVVAPVCTGSLASSRTVAGMSGVIWAPDNNTNGTFDIITIADAGTISDVNVTLTTEGASAGDIDAFLVSPNATQVELFTDRASSSAFSITDATFDDASTSLLSTSSADEPYTATWRPEGAGGLAAMNGGPANGDWRLRIIDDSSSPTGGSRLVRWSLDITGSFAAPQFYSGSVTDSSAFDSGLASIVLNSAVNTQITVDPFAAGASSATYVVSLVDSSTNGSGTVVATDLQGNTCSVNVSLAGLLDVTGPGNSGELTTDARFSAEAQLNLTSNDPLGVTSSINVPGTNAVGEVEAAVTIDTLDAGRIACTLSHGGDRAVLLNRVGMEERDSVGLTKDIIDPSFDDDASTDAHLHPALGSTPFRGPHQPDGRGEFIGNGINTDDRDNMLFDLANVPGNGSWTLYAADFREQSAASAKSRLRRWSMTLRNACGPQRYYGKAFEEQAGSGIDSIVLGAGATNLSLTSSFVSGAAVATYVVEVVNPMAAGSGNVEIRDVAGNLTTVPISLAAGSVDVNPPVASGSTDLTTDTFTGTASDIQAGDSGLADVALAPWSTNLQINSVSPALPAGSVTFEVGLVAPGVNGRGYVRVTDGCGWRTYVLVEIDAITPACTGSYGTTKRYRSTGAPITLTDNDPSIGITSDILVSDPDIISDVNVTVNITHAFDDDIDISLISPSVIALWNDIGSTGNDFFNTTIDDQAAGLIPDLASAAPFDGSFQALGGPAVLAALNGNPAFGTYTLKVVDDAQFNRGTLDRWALTMTSPTFPRRFAAEARDGLSLDSGIATVELLPGANNLTLNVDPFTAGDRLVIYEIVQTNPANCGSGTLRITDVAGNSCTRVIALPKIPGDTSGNDVVDLGDLPTFVDALLMTGDCAADLNFDGRVDGDDVQPFADCVIGGVCP